jgi:hypothetical protein
MNAKFAVLLAAAGICSPVFSAPVDTSSEDLSDVRGRGTQSDARNHLDQTAVTVPLKEIRQLLEVAAGAGRPEAPPVPAALTKALTKLSLDPVHPTGSAEFDVNLLAVGWQLIPLLGTAFTLTDVSPADAVILAKDGMLCLLSDRPGPARVTVTFDVD